MTWLKRLMRFGFVPHTVSGISIFSAFCLMFAHATFAVVLMNAGMRSGQVIIGGIIRAMASRNYFHFGPVSIPVALFDLAWLLALLVDVPVRFARHFHEDQWAGGFLEWLRPQARSKEQLSGAND